MADATVVPRLFLLDGMALVYRAHFAFATRPIRTSKGVNTSALFGFVTTLLDLLERGRPTHLAVALDTAAPTERHREYPEYKAQREEMPEELAAALPHLRRVLTAFRVPVLALDGYEADDIIGTLVKHAERAGFDSFMVTPDKDFGQLVTERTKLWKPGRQGADAEILGPAEVCARWGISRVDQVIDLLGLMGDHVDNIPGVPGVGEKTAAKLLSQYGTLEDVLAHADQVKGKLGESLRAHGDTARLSKRLATIQTDVPLQEKLDDLVLRPRDDAATTAICVEFEFNAIGRRLFGEAFRAGRGAVTTPSEDPPTSNAARKTAKPRAAKASPTEANSPQGDLFSPPTPPSSASPASTSPETPEPSPDAPADNDAGRVDPPHRPHRTIRDVPHDYRCVTTDAERRQLAARLHEQPAFCFDTETDGLDPIETRLVGLAFSWSTGTGWYVAINPSTARPTPPELEPFLALLAEPGRLKIGHNLKFDLAVLRRHGVPVQGPFFDTMIAHALVEPDLRHGMDYLAESLLDYTPVPIDQLIGPKNAPHRTMAEVPLADIAEYAAEDADVTWQLCERLRPMLSERHQERVFHDVEMPVLPAIVSMEHEGIRIDAAALAEYGAALAREMAAAEAEVQQLAGRAFNVNSPKQLGTVLFDELRLAEKPKKTATGQYATDEQTLSALAGSHPIIRRLLDYRAAAKLKSTYADALPAAISPTTQRVHSTFHQAATATGRLSSVDPNLQNIPIRTERGQEIRRAFIPREGWKLLSADYSQIELRIIAALAGETSMIEAFQRGDDIHRDTAARVFGVAPAEVTAEQRRRAKAVNFGIIYGISAFGLSQRLGIPRSEGSAIIEQYFAYYPGIRSYIDLTLDFARKNGFVQTLTGRRRYLRDINSANATLRSATERNAINAPIQGTAADMIKLAMARIHEVLEQRRLQTRLLLQVHDELLFDVEPAEENDVRTLVEERMRTALPLPGAVPIAVEIGSGSTWLEAH